MCFTCSTCRLGAKPFELEEPSKAKQGKPGKPVRTAWGRFL